MSIPAATAIDIQQNLSWKPMAEADTIDVARQSQPGQLRSSTSSRSRLQLITAENSTEIVSKPKDIQTKIELLFAAARDEIFEDGMQSQFSRKLISYVKEYGNIAMAALTEYTLSERANAEIVAEALRWVGHINDPLTYRDRLWLLERCLSSSSPRARDGAGLGLAFLDDPHAIPYLRRAIGREVYDELRDDLKQVLSQLLNTK